MEDTKEEVIADLYALRAGLSVISEKADRVRKLENNVKDIELQMVNSNTLTQQMVDLANETENQILTVKAKVKSIEDIIVSKGNSVDKLKEIRAKLTETIKKGGSTEDLKRSVEAAEYSLKCSTLHVSREHASYSVKLLFGMFFLWWVALMIAMTVCFSTGLINLERTLDLIMFIVTVVGSFVYAVIIFPIMSYRKHERICKEKYESDLKTAKAADEALKNNLINDELVPLENALQGIEKKIANQKQISADFEKQLAQLKIDTADSVKAIAGESKDIEHSLCRQFDKLIIASDWQNTDLIIFYLKTGRADNMKEALQLADKQRQTDAIVKEIRQANASICNEIGGGLKTLGLAMGKCFDLLSKQINEQHKQTMSAMRSFADSSDKMAETIVELKEQNEKLVTVAQLNNALQAKANVTSDILKNDLEFMQLKMGIRN